MIDVFHDLNPVFRVDPYTLSKFQSAAVRHLYFVKVATVDVEDLEEAFRLTNNIDHSWLSNAKVEPTPVIVGKGGCRSTSVGDVLVPHGTGRFKGFVVANRGFISVSKAIEDGKVEA